MKIKRKPNNDPEDVSFSKRHKAEEKHKKKTQKMAEIAAADSMARRILAYHEEQPCDSCSQLRSTLAANETELDNLKDTLHT